VNEAPQVIDWRINEGQPQRSAIQAIAIQFNDDVSASLDPGDLALRNLDTDELVADWQLTFDPATHIASLSFPSLARGLADQGHYRLTVLAQGINDAQGLVMTADADLQFHVLEADANGDRKVNDLDLYRIWQNLLKSEETRDLNDDITGDGVVDLGDLSLVVNNYLDVLPTLAPQSLFLASTSLILPVDHLQSSAPLLSPSPFEAPDQRNSRLNGSNRSRHVTYSWDDPLTSSDPFGTLGAHGLLQRLEELTKKKWNVLS